MKFSTSGNKMIPFYYSTYHRNFGDALNPYLWERIFNIKLKKSDFAHAEAVGVGSLLQKCTASKYAVLKRFSGHFKPALQVWSSGFIAAVPPGQVLTRKLEVKALRGHRSRQIIEQLTQTPCDCAVGDGGLLYPLLLDKIPAKKYPLGIIPHYRDQQLDCVKSLAAQFPGAVVIDVLDEPLEVLKQIAACERIFSSSLHGLIVADALDIPNRHVRFSGNVTGSEFKFGDYYSVFAPEYLLPSLTPAAAHAMTLEELSGDFRSKLPQIKELQTKLLAALQR